MLKTDHLAKFKILYRGIILDLEVQDFVLSDRFQRQILEEKMVPLIIATLLRRKRTGDDGVTHYHHAPPTELFRDYFHHKRENSFVHLPRDVLR
jgi:hypothetical protein